MKSAKRCFDIVLFGATGFTGRLTAEYLAQHSGRKLRWAIAGRDLKRLDALRKRLAQLDPACIDLPMMHADTSDPESVRALARSTKVLATTVGPYIRHGEPVVAACVEAGTDYVDLTGEPEFVNRMWLRYDDKARDSGARIVNCCGFESVPHDLGAYFTVQKLPEGVPIKIEAFVRGGGRLSGGVLSSAAVALSRWREYGQLKRERARREGTPVDRKIAKLSSNLRYNRKLGSWTVPMPSIDANVVLHSAMADDRYGSEFRFGHYLQLKDVSMLAGVLGGMAALAVAAQIKPVHRRLVALSNRGVGPSEAERAEGWFSVRFVGCGGGQKVFTEVSGGDPGYNESAKILAESALCLAFDRIERRPGVQTPVHAMGAALIRRLQNAGIEFKEIEPFL